MTADSDSNLDLVGEKTQEESGLTCPHCQGHNIASDGNTAYCFGCHHHDEQWIFEIAGELSENEEPGA